jgi:FkbM family methyltransferase
MNSSSLLLELNSLLNKPIESIKDHEISLFTQLFEKLDQRVVLFGAGNFGRKCLSKLRSLGIEPLAFIDNNPAVWGNNIEGIDIVSPETAAENYGQDALFIITIFSRENDLNIVRQQLKEIGCAHVICCVSLLWCYSEKFLPYYSIDLPHKIYEQADDVMAAFHLLSDDASKAEYLKQIKWRISPEEFDSLSPSQEMQYFPSWLLPILKNEFFVDCGAFDGDTIKTFIKLNGDCFEKFICFEPDPTNIKNLEIYVSSLDIQSQQKIVIYPNATGQRREKLLFMSDGSEGSAISSKGNLEVDSISLDEILENEAPTFIKMDIEGAEIDAIIGATKTIKNYSPILAISVYHLQDHLWRALLLINSICTDYSFYLVPHGFNGMDTILYGIPNSRFSK